MGKEKVDEQHIFVKCSKCTGLGVISKLLKVATSPFTRQLWLKIEVDEIQKDTYYA